MIKKIILTLVLLLFVAVGSLFAINGKDNYDPSKFSATASNGLTPGSKIGFTLPDQFGKPVTLTPKTKKVIFVFAKATGHTVREFLKKQDKSYLPARDALFVADVSGMPTVIRNTFALPDFRKSPYSVALIYDKAIAATYKNKKDADKITIVTLDNGVIKDLQTITTEDALKAALQ
jgi:hypothetical protein